MYVKYGRSVSGKNSSIFAGVGSASAPYVDPLASDTADLNFEGIWAQTNATSGTSRLSYRRLYLASGAGGECDRVFTTVSSDTPADTVNGSHISLSFGSTAGNVTGEGQAVRGTLHVPNRSLGGTCAAVKAELFADGASSDVSNTAFIRCVLAGNSTGATAIQTSGKFMTVDGVGAAGSGKILQENTATASTHILKCSVDGVAYGLMLVSL